MNWGLWIRQTLTVIKMELKRYVLARRWLGVYLFAFAPVLLLMVAAILTPRVPRLLSITTAYAVFFQTFMLRLSIFFSCAMVFSHIFRGEVLEKTLHFYLLAPVRREVLMLGKYLAGVVAMSLIFGVSTILTNFFIYVPHPQWKTFFLEGDGFSNLTSYVVVTVMACVGYGAVFLLVGTFFKNPAFAAIILGGWEAFFFILPAKVQKFTIMHYLQSMLPVGIDMGPFAVVVDPTSPIVGIPVLAVLAGALVWAAGQVLRRVQVTYSTD
jgi:ABC-type transport system involved in multi-copper enzyme maturation permease subunit